MLATVVWIGALVTMGIFVLPLARQTLSPEDYVFLVEKIQRRLDPIAWFCLASLIVTGLVQMSANPNYSGFLTIDNQWGFAILLKHILFIGMVIVSGYITWSVIPGIRHMALRQAKGLDIPDPNSYQRRELNLIRLNLLLSLLILALTSLARTS